MSRASRTRSPAPNYRGRGIAPAAWGGIATSLRERGLQTLITKVGTDNPPSRKACLKAGFIEIGLMRVKRIGPRYRVHIDEPNGVTGEFLARVLER
jgi:RimJ/RimL family protein N-acetyltransferase